MLCSQYILMPYIIADYIYNHLAMYILIWDAHTRMGQYYMSHAHAYGTSHTCMGRYTHMGQNSYSQTGISYTCERQNECSYYKDRVKL